MHSPVQTYPVPGTLDDVLGFELLESSSDGCRARFAVERRVQQPMGLVHGGAYAAAVAAVCGEQDIRLVGEGLEGARALHRALSYHSHPKQNGATSVVAPFMKSADPAVALIKPGQPDQAAEAVISAIAIAAACIREMPPFDRRRQRRAFREHPADTEA